MEHPHDREHFARRRSHLHKKLKIPFKDIPSDPREPAVINHVGSANIFTRTRLAFEATLPSKTLWPQSHQVHFVRHNNRNYWTCSLCNLRMEFWQVPQTLCSQASAPSGARIMPLAARIKLWHSWWDQAKAAAAEQVHADRAAHKRASFQVQQAVRAARYLPSRPSMFQGFRPVPADPPPSGSVWWSCPYCPFQVKHGEARHPYSKCLYHLSRVHQISGEHLPRGNKLSHPGRLIASRKAVQARWARQLEEFAKVRWPGAHDIAPDPVHVHVTHGTKRTYQKARFQCRRCLHTLPAAEVVTSLCTATSGKAPALSSRKKIWQKCRRLATAAIKGPGPANKKRHGLAKSSSSKKPAGAAATRRGLRGVRVGEASHPGPPVLRVATWNINSFHNHFRELCRVASAQACNVLFLQESGITQNQLPAASNLCQRHGWQLLVAPAKSVQDGGRGGVAIMVTEPLAISRLYMHCGTWGQILAAELLGHKEPVSLLCAYRRPNANLEGPLQELTECFSKIQHRKWIFSTDWNSSPHHGTLPDFLQKYRDSLVGSSGHLRSSSPTD